MEQVVRGMIAKSAERLGLDASGPAVLEAIAVAHEAILSGYDVEQSFEFARSVLIKAATPAEVFAAA